MLSCVCGILFCTRQLRRNEEVGRFRQEIIDLLSATAQKRIKAGRSDWEELYSYLNKYSYDAMLNSFKPLKLESWYTEEEIKIMKGE